MLRASFWLAPCFSNKPCDFPENKTRDASDRLLPPERFTCTRTSCVPSSLRDFHRVDTPRSLGLRAVDRGTGCFTTPANASADRSWACTAIVPWFACRRLPTVQSSPGVGVLFPRRQLTDRASDTSVASSSSAGDHRSAFATPFDALALASRERSRVRKPPRSP